MSGSQQCLFHLKILCSHPVKLKLCRYDTKKRNNSTVGTSVYTSTADTHTHSVLYSSVLVACCKKMLILHGWFYGWSWFVCVQPPVAQTSKNFAEMRERLRRRLKQRVSVYVVWSHRASHKTDSCFCSLMIENDGHLFREHLSIGSHHYHSPPIWAVSWVKIVFNPSQC